MKTLALAATALLLGACSAAPTTDRPAPEKADTTVPGVLRDNIWRVGPTYIAGQPSVESLEELKRRGVTAVVNVRTPTEMENSVDYDEPAAAHELGLEYVFIPSSNSGEYAYSPAMVARFAEVMDAHDGNVLLHCTVAWRASHLWAAYLIEHRGYTIDDAVSEAREINFGTLPLEGFLGARVGYDVE